MNAVFGNLQEIIVYHKGVVLPMIEKAVVESKKDWEKTDHET